MFVLGGEAPQHPQSASLLCVLPMIYNLFRALALGLTVLAGALGARLAALPREEANDATPYRQNATPSLWAEILVFYKEIL